MATQWTKVKTDPKLFLFLNDVARTLGGAAACFKKGSCFLETPTKIFMDEIWFLFQNNLMGRGNGWE